MRLYYLKKELDLESNIAEEVVKKHFITKNILI